MEQIQRRVFLLALLALLLTGFGRLAEAGSVPQTVSVGGQLFIDADGDGSYNPSAVPGDRPLSGVFVRLAGPDGSPVTDVNGVVIGTAEAGVPNTMSGAGSGDTAEPGRFEFLDLPVLATGESYTVSIEPPSTDPLTLISPDDGILTTSALDTAGASDDTLTFIFGYAAAATQATLHPVQEHPLSTERILTSLVEPGVPTDMVFTVYSVGAEPIVDVDMYFDVAPDDDTAIVCNPPATPDEPLAGGQVLLELTGPFEAGTSFTCRFTVRALAPGEEAHFNVIYWSFGATSGTEASGDVMPYWSLIASAPEVTTTTTSTSSTIVARSDPADELPMTGTHSPISGWAVALIAAGTLLLITSTRRPMTGPS